VIFVDPRHGSGKRRSHDIGPALDTFDVPHESQLLDSGDACFFGNGPDGPIKVGIELKVIPDFVSSMLSGHLADQLERMHEDGYQRIYVIIEGVFRASRRSGLLEVPRGKRWLPLFTGSRPVTWIDVERYITGLEEQGVRVRRTRTPYETAKVIASVLYAWWSKQYDEHSLNTLYVPETFSLTREDEVTRRIRRVLKSMKVGISDGRSKAVAEHFGSIYGFVTADEGAWAGIEGVGKGIVGDVQKAIHAVAPGFTPTVSTTAHTSASGVSQRHRAADRGTRNSRRRAYAGVDAGRRPQRRVHKTRRSR
jgi:ERCC4-type nuclease